MQAPSIAAEPDEEGLQYLDVQRHAAAVQLLGRSLPVAHLRAQMAMPKGGALHLPQKSAVLIKQEDGTSQAATRQQQQQQQRGLAAAAQHADVQQQVIKVSVVTTADDLPPQPAAAQPQPHQPPHQHQQHARGATALKPRQLVHRLPDAAAAARFTSDELPDDDSAAAGAAAAAGDNEFMDIDAPPAAVDPATEQKQQQQLLAPRMVGDPGQVAQQLAGWVRVNVGVEGGEAEGAPGQHDDEFEEDGLLGQGAAEADDMLDEEEWV